MHARFSIEASHDVRRTVEALDGELAAARGGRAPELRQLQSLVPDEREHAVRASMMRAEASRDADKLNEAFEVLAAMLCNSSRFERGLSVARGHERWARSLQRPEDVAIACLLQAWGHWGIGDHASAGAASASAIIARGTFDPRLRVSLIPEIRALDAPPGRAAAVETCRAGIRALATEIPMYRTLQGRDAELDSAALTQRYAAASLSRRETTLVRVYAILAAQQHRGVADYAGTARCVDLLADAAEIEQRVPQAERLRAKATRYRQL